jgi:hypothetical protein
VLTKYRNYFLETINSINDRLRETNEKYQRCNVLQRQRDLAQENAEMKETSKSNT